MLECVWSNFLAKFWSHSLKDEQQLCFLRIIFDLSSIQATNNNNNNNNNNDNDNTNNNLQKSSIIYNLTRT